MESCPPGQEEAAAIARAQLLTEAMGTDMDGTVIPAKRTTDRPRPELTKPKAKVAGQDQSINSDKITERRISE